VNPIGIRSCYDEGKRVAESLCMDYHRQNKVDIRIVRIFNTYGPRMHPNDGRVVSNFIVQALKGEPVTIYGEGTQTRSFCYVDDLVEGLIRMMRNEQTIGPVNLGNPTEITVKELAERVIQTTGSSSKIVAQPLPQDDPRKRKPDITLAKKYLGWEPRVPLEEGLRKTIEYFKATV
jgi:UDP-glucuronate decarboxylase